MSKCLAIKTGDNTLEPTAQTNNTFTAIKLAVLEELAKQNFTPNTELTIEESGDFIVPVSGWYDITVIGGGGGGHGVFSGGGSYSMESGTAAAVNHALLYLEKDAVIPVEIGAGGIGNTASGSTQHYATASRFGDIVSNAVPTEEPYDYAGGAKNASGYGVVLTGKGRGGGLPQKTGNSGRWYGAGGGCYYVPADDIIYVGNGHPGAVILRWHDPDKAPPVVLENLY